MPRMNGATFSVAKAPKEGGPIAARSTSMRSRTPGGSFLRCARSRR